MKLQLPSLFFAFFSCISAQQINLLTWPSTAFAPPDAATPSFIPNVNLTSFVGDYSSARIFGAISTSLPADLITFTIRTDGGVLLWVDDHLIGESRREHGPGHDVTTLTFSRVRAVRSSVHCRTTSAEACCVKNASA